MTRTILLYGLWMTLGLVGVRVAEYAFVSLHFDFEVYLGLVGLGFLALGVFLGLRLRRPAPQLPPATASPPETPAADGFSTREREVLHFLALGYTNQQIADALFVSPNTVKTHLARLYEKLGVNRRARALQLLP